MGALGKVRRLLLLNPKRGSRFHWDMEEVAKTVGKKVATQPLALPLLAALTPKHWDVQIIDEEMDRVRFRRRPDLIGITAMISNIRRAYELADRFRAQGITVVMGGPQVSYDVEGTLERADSVVVGEAEGIWDTCLADFEAGRLQRTYQAAERGDFRTSPIPRWDLVDSDNIMGFSVQVSRGCPHQCEFCVVHNLFGRQQRYRDIDDVIREIEALPGKQVNFADDNLTANKKYSREFMRRLEPLGIAWTCQAGLDVAYDKELLAQMRRAGCQSILIGFESLDPAALEQARKAQNRIQDYQVAVSNLHQAGIHPIASFVVGFESDTLDAFDQISRFCEDNCLSYVMINALGAYPGSQLWDRMVGEDRVTPIDTDLITGMYPNIKYKNFSQVDMFRKGNEVVEKLYSYESLCRKAQKVVGNGSFMDNADPGLSLWTKVRSTLTLARRHLLTRNRYKRKLFIELFKLVKENKAAPAAVVQYLMFADSFNGFLESCRAQNALIVEKLKENERTGVTVTKRAFVLGP